MKGMDAGAAMAHAIVDELGRCGVRDACLSPGSRSAPLAYALRSHPDIRLHVVIDERSASFRALGLAKATGRPVAMITTSGTAAANVHPAVVEAHHSRTPLIVMTADRPPELRDTGAGQTIDQIKLFGDAVAWFCETGVAEDLPGSNSYWRSIACRAVDASRLGPVHMNLALREPLVPAPDAVFSSGLEGRADGKPWTMSFEDAPRCSAGEVAYLSDLISVHERGVVVAGTGRFDPRAVVRLAESAGWPLLAEAVSGARFGPNAISTYDALLRHGSFATRYRPDVAVRIGSIGTSRALAAWLSEADRQVQIGGWLDASRSVDTAFRSDVSALCDAVSETQGDPRQSAWLQEWRSSEATARRSIDAVLDASSVCTEPLTARDVAESVPPGGTLVVASSMPIRDLDWFMRPHSKDSRVTFIANRGANGIDGFISTAVGAALASEGPCVALCGDLSLIHDQNGLQGASRTDLTIVVINNDGGGIFSFLPHADVGPVSEELFGTPHGIDIADIASVFGCQHELVEDPARLRQIVGDESAGLRLVEVRTDRSDNVKVHRMIWDEVARRLR